MLDHLKESIDTIIQHESHTAIQHLHASLREKDQRYDALRDEYDQLHKVSSLKEALLQERSDILKSELLSSKVTEMNKDQLTQAMIPKLQSQLSQLETALASEKHLSHQLSDELKQRDAQFESLETKFEQLSEEYLHVQELVKVLNERIFEQGNEIELWEKKEKSMKELLTRVTDEKQVEVTQVRKTEEEKIAKLENDLREARSQSSAKTAELSQTIGSLESELAALRSSHSHASTQHESALASLALKHEIAVKEMESSHHTELKHVDQQWEARHQQWELKLKELERQSKIELEYRRDEAQRQKAELESKVQLLTSQVRTLEDTNARLVQERSMTDTERDRVAQSDRDELHKLRMAYAKLETEADQKARKYEQLSTQFQSVLKDDEHQIAQLVHQQTARVKELKTKHAAELHHIQTRLTQLETERKAAEDAAAVAQMHVASMTATVEQAKAREEEALRTLKSDDLKHGNELRLRETQLSALREQHTKLTHEHADKSRSFDRLLLEKETEHKRMASELEARLEKQRSNFRDERASLEKEVMLLRHTNDQTKHAHEAEVRELVAKHEVERQQLVSAHKNELEARLHELTVHHHQHPSQAMDEYMRAQMRDAIENEKRRLEAEGYVTNEQVDVLLKNKLDEANLVASRQLFHQQQEYERRFAELKTQYQQDYARAIDETEKKYAGEHAKVIQQVREECHRYETDVASERTKQQTLAEEVTRLKSQIVEMEGKHHALQISLTSEQRSTQDALQQCETGTHVIEKLKDLLATERRTNVEKYEALLQQHRDELQTQRHQLAQSHEELRAQHQTQLHELERDHRSTVESLEKRHAHDTEVARSQWSQERSNLLLERTTDAIKHETVLHHAESELLKLRDTMEHRAAEHARHVTALETEHRHEVDQLRHQQTQETNELAERVRALETQHARQLDAMRHDHQLAFTRTEQQEHEAHARLETMRKEFDAKEAEHVAKIDELTSDHQRRLDQRDDDLRAVNERLRVTETQLHAKRDELARIVGMKSELESSLARLRSHHTELQHSVRHDLTRLYSVSTHALAQLHSATHDLNRRLVASDATIRQHIERIDELERDLERRAHEFAELQAAHATELDTLRQEHQLELTLRGHGSSSVRAHEEDIEALQRRLKEMEQLHAEQMMRLRKEHEEEYRQQLRHVEELLHIKAGVDVRQWRNERTGATSSYASSPMMRNTNDRDAVTSTGDGDRNPNRPFSSSFDESSSAAAGAAAVSSSASLGVEGHVRASAGRTGTHLHRSSAPMGPALNLSSLNPSLENSVDPGWRPASSMRSVASARSMASYMPRNAMRDSVERQGEASIATSAPPVSLAYLQAHPSVSSSSSSFARPFTHHPHQSSIVSHPSPTISSISMSSSVGVPMLPTEDEVLSAYGPIGTDQSTDQYSHSAKPKAGVTNPNAPSSSPDTITKTDDEKAAMSEDESKESHDHIADSLLQPLQPFAGSSSLSRSPSPAPLPHESIPSSDADDISSVTPPGPSTVDPLNVSLSTDLTADQLLASLLTKVHQAIEENTKSATTHPSPYRHSPESHSPESDINVNDSRSSLTHSSSQLLDLSVSELLKAAELNQRTKALNQ